MVFKTREKQKGIFLQKNQTAFKAKQTKNKMIFKAKKTKNKNVI